MKEGTVYIKDGRKWVKKRYGDAIYWTQEMLYDLRKFFPVTSDNEVAEILGVGEMTVRRKARELGLHKSKAWLDERDKRRTVMAGIACSSGRNPGCFKKGHWPANAFKVGHSYNCKQVIRLDTMQVYESAKSLAVDLGVKPFVVYSALQRNGRCAGVKPLWLKTYNGIKERQQENNQYK